MRSKYLQDSAFLKEVDNMRIKEQCVKITVLNFLEKPIQEVQGKVTDGSINIDGSSAVRRTANITVFATDNENDLTQATNLFSINKKIKLEVGIKNTTGKYTEYDYLWFPLGIYGICSASLSHSNGGVSISLSLKDKMCFLNGDCGGILPASVTFNEVEELDENGEYYTTYPTIYQIIQELVNHYGGEQLPKIIINDIDLRAKQVMKWIGSNDLYAQIDYSSDDGLYIYNFFTDDESSKRIDATFVYGDDIGYQYTDFTYPGELIGNAGDTVVTILDKIKNTLGNYEYFYDLDGNFVFQEIKNYLNTSQSTYKLEELKDNATKLNQLDASIYNVDRTSGKAVYVFDDNSIITSYSNAPDYSNVKNEFIVWGIRTAADTNYTFPIRYRLAIDNKPTVGNTYTINDKNITTTDWRTELYAEGYTASLNGLDHNIYYEDLVNEWPKLYDIENNKYWEEYSDSYGNLIDGTDIDYFLDFIEPVSANLANISVDAIGRRTKVVSDNDVNCLFAPDIPDVILIEQGSSDATEQEQEAREGNMSYSIMESTLYQNMATGGHYNSAYDTIIDLLYQYTTYNESISLQAIPIFYLEPNTRITVRDAASGIYGDYVIKSISLPLDISGTMSLSCTKALQRI